MSKSILEIIIAVEAAPTIASEIEDLFKADLTLRKAIETLLHEKLEAAGISDDFKVYLNEDRLHIKAHSSGGLDSAEWLEKGGLGKP